MMDFNDPFAPLADDAEPRPSSTTSWKIVLPVPADAPALPSNLVERVGTAQFGCTRWWAYRNADGALLGYTVRYDAIAASPEATKKILPFTFWERAGGTREWRCKSFPAPRPLYGLDRLAARPEAPVLIAEGEKSTDAAAERFASHVAVTSPGGSNSAGSADWSPLAGRHVVIWPDADEAGARYAEDVARHVEKAGAASVRGVNLPTDLPLGWDLADPPPPEVDLDSLLSNARPIRRTAHLPPGFAMKNRGLVWRNPDDDSKPELVIAGRFEVLAETRDGEGTSWGVLLSWRDHDGREHRLSLPRASLAGDGAEARRLLLDGGLYVAPIRACRERLTAFLISVRSDHRVTATSRIGWHGPTFVLPGGSIGPLGSEELLLQGGSAVEHSFRSRGTLEEWQHQVGGYAQGNSRLVLALSMAFAAALLEPCGAESGGVHLNGASSTGKSTALAVAGSVWGGGGPGGYVRSWRATANGLESVALGHCDALLCLDELAQIAPKDAGEAAYMLANGSAKSRSRRDGSARTAARWRVLFLSSGEIGLADKVAEDGRGTRLAAGQQVRIVDLAADAGAGLGLFEELHGFPSADALARHLKQASSAQYGTACQAFLERIAGELNEVKVAASQSVASFIAAHVPADADGQVERVARRFGLIAAAGEIAVTAGILPWSPGEALGAAARCFRDWLDARGGTGPAEIRDGTEKVRGFLLANGQARFLAAWEKNVERVPPIRDLAGFRQRTDAGWDYFITPAAWRDEVCRGFDSRAIAKALADSGMLVVPPTGRHRAGLVTVPEHGRPRLYHIPARFLAEDVND
jgi:uncharacterized protein (DUF927 family)